MKKIVIFLGLSAALFANDAYVGTPAKILDKVGGKEIGQLFVGAKVKVLKDSSNFAEVEYNGFVPGEGNTAYARLGVLESDISVKNDKNFKKNGVQKDDYDNEWIKVSVKGAVEKKALKPNLDEVYKPGEELFKERCGACHALHGYDEFNVNVWPSVIKTMIGNAGLDETETQTLTRFLQSKAPIE